MTLTMMTSHLALAECNKEKGQLKDIISACDKSLETKNYVIELQNQALQQAMQANTLNDSRAREAEEKLNSAWRNPYLYLALGLLGGFLIAR